MRARGPAQGPTAWPRPPHQRGRRDGLPRRDAETQPVELVGAAVVADESLRETVGDGRRSGLRLPFRRMVCLLTIPATWAIA
eukprot:6487007-Amphidinium_carterae.2